MNNKQRLLNACELLNVSINSNQVDQLIEYLDQINKWNKIYNITAIRNVDQMLVHHIFDSLSIINEFKKLYKNTVQPLIIDVGSGGGLPGVVMAIMGLGRVVCVDAVQKKSTFVQQVSAVLGVSNLKSVHARIEDLPSFNADCVISRAFSSLDIFVNLASYHVSNNGYILAMKGIEPEGELKALEDGKTGWQVKQITSLKVPELEAKRCLITMHNKGDINGAE